MGDFQYLFELFTLLVALAVATVLKGFADMLKLPARARAGVIAPERVPRFGWLLPLLGLLTLIDLATLWELLYLGRNSIPFNLATTLSVLLLIGIYYLIADLLWPDEPLDWPDFDVYFWQHKRLIVLGILAVSILAQMGLAAFDTPIAVTREQFEEIPLLGILSILLLTLVPALVWLAFTRNKKVALTLLLWSIFVQLAYAIAFAAIPSSELLQD